MSAKSKIEIWFFREMSDEQRLALFSIFGYPIDEIGKTHGHQRKALRRILSDLDVDRDRQLSQASHGAVKALKWNTGSRVGSYYAKGLGIAYAIDTDHNCAVLAKGDGSRILESAYSTAEQAKAAAQADFARRILSSLEPAAPGREESVAIPAGYHLLSDAELQARDNAVLERAAAVAERWTPFPKPTSRSALYWLTHCAKPNIAASIRAMQGGKP